jgi:hypothetical protein
MKPVVRFTIIAFGVNTFLTALLFPIRFQSGISHPALAMALSLFLVMCTSLYLFRLWNLEENPHPWVAGLVLAVWILPFSFQPLVLASAPVSLGYVLNSLLPVFLIFQIAISFFVGTLISGLSRFELPYYIVGLICSALLSFCYLFFLTFTP